MPKKDEKSFGSMTWEQSATLWWSIFWRGTVIILLPLMIVNIIFDHEMPKSIFIDIIIFIISWAIAVAVQRHVINKVEFSNFSLSVTQKFEGRQTKTSDGTAVHQGSSQISRKCPHCGESYNITDYETTAAHWFCPYCNHELQDR